MSSVNDATLKRKRTSLGGVVIIIYSKLIIIY
jgi:hypothetical protein